MPPMAMKLAAIRIDTLIASRKGKKGENRLKISGNAMRERATEEEKKREDGTSEDEREIK